MESDYHTKDFSQPQHRGWQTNNDVPDTRARYEAPRPIERPAISADTQERKALPMATGLLDYFPGALAEVARVSRVANEQHNPGEPMHWARGKSTDHADTILRHLIDRGRTDSDGLRHSAKVAWRALALLQEELEAEGAAPGRASRFE